MTSPFLGEFLGTAVLILLGNGVVAGVVLKKSKAEASGWIVITAGWALAVMAGVFTSIACGSSDAHLNPAVTIGIRSADRKLREGVAVLCGADCWAQSWERRWCGFTICRIGARRKIPRRNWLASARRRRFGALCPNLVSEIIGTFVLVFVVGAIFSKSVAATGPGALGPYLVGSLVWGIGLSLGGTTGYAINPARDFGPRVAHAVLPVAGKGGSDWGYAPIPVFGPLIGGTLAGLLLKLLALN